jgi:Fur family ferric uptake transcriptional regulator
MAHEVEQRTLARYLEEHSLKHTKQREAILDVFLSVTGHITGEEIYRKVRDLHPGIGYTTVYRTMKLLCEAGLAHEHNFDGTARYEIAHEHHDHLVCTRCGKIVEFECEMIESAQEKIASEYGFRVLRHRHELYGHCSDCQDPGSGGEPSLS